jgi:hypothetical protein
MFLANELHAEAIYAFRWRCCSQRRAFGLHKVRNHASDGAGIDATAEEDADGHICTQTIAECFEQSLSYTLYHFFFRPVVYFALLKVSGGFVTWM